MLYFLYIQHPNPVTIATSSSISSGDSRLHAMPSTVRLYFFEVALHQLLKQELVAAQLGYCFHLFTTILGFSFVHRRPAPARMSLSQRVGRTGGVDNIIHRCIHKDIIPRNIALQQLPVFVSAIRGKALFQFIPASPRSVHRDILMAVQPGIHQRGSDAAPTPASAGASRCQKLHLLTARSAGQFHRMRRWNFRIIRKSQE